MPVDQYKQYWDRYYQAIKNINDNDNIFDIIAVLYLLVTESGIHENVAINSYFVAMNVIEVDDDDECEREIESLFISRASVMSFKTYLLQYKYKKIFHPNLYCVKLILQIDIMCDQLFDITSIPLDTCIKIGPLNKNSRDILVYPKSKNDLYDRIGKQLKLRKTLMYQTGTLNAKLKHLLIIKRSCLDIKGVNHAYGVNQWPLLRP